LNIQGGQFGLFMGASFLSFAEFFEMFVNIFLVMLKHRKKQNKNKISTKA
jgi:hypothetical protein